MAYSIYTITVTKFNEHNSGLKKGHKATLISNNFCDDSKLGTLPVTVRWLFLGIILTCGDHTRDTVEMNERQLRALLESSWSIDRALSSLEELQLLSYQKTPPNRIEKNRKEENRKENKRIPATLNKKSDSEENRKIWATYENAYRLRYGINPVKNATVNSQVSNLRKKLGTEEAVMVVEFFLRHENSFYLKNTHTFGLCLKDAETLRTQAIKGVAITSGMVKNFEKKQNENEIIAALEKQWGKNE